MTMKRLIPLLCVVVMLVGMFAVPVSAAASAWYQYNDLIAPIDPLAGNTDTDSTWFQQCIIYIPDKDTYLYVYMNNTIMARDGHPGFFSSASYLLYYWNASLSEWAYDENWTLGLDTVTSNTVIISNADLVWSLCDVIDIDTGGIYMEGTEPEIVLNYIQNSDSISDAIGNVSSDEIHYSESGEHAVGICSPASYSYEMNDTAAPLALRVDGPDDAVITYQWYCAITSDYTDVEMLDCGVNAYVNPVTVLPGLYRYICIVKFTETVDGVLTETYVASPVYYVSVYAHDDSDLTDIKDSISEIELTQIAISGKLDEVIESISNITVSFDEMQQTLDGIQTELTGTPEAEKEADEFNQTIDEKNEEFNEGMDILGGMTEPNYEDIDASFDDIFGDDSKGDGIDLATKVISALFDNDYIFQVFFIAFMLALVSFVVFGKR